MHIYVDLRQPCIDLDKRIQLGLILLTLLLFLVPRWMLFSQAVFQLKANVHFSSCINQYHLQTSCLLNSPTTYFSSCIIILLNPFKYANPSPTTYFSFFSQGNFLKLSKILIPATPLLALTPFCSHHKSSSPLQWVSNCSELLEGLHRGFRQNRTILLGLKLQF